MIITFGIYMLKYVMKFINDGVALAIQVTQFTCD